MRSRIKMFASTAIATFRLMPAMPGSVSVAPRSAIAASSRSRFSVRPTTAITPSTL
jgi:hypothetical protein